MLPKRCRAAQAATATDCIREDLFSPCIAGGGSSRDDSGERARMLANNERIAQGTDRLKGAHATVLDMESTAGSILGDLGRQRQTMMGTWGRMKEAGEQLDASSRILKQMARRGRPLASRPRGPRVLS